MSYTDTFYEWLIRKPSWRGYLVLCATLFAAKVTWTALTFTLYAFYVLHTEGVWIFGLKPLPGTVDFLITRYGVWGAVGILGLTILCEELLFRLVPFLIVLAAIRVGKDASRLTVTTIILSSALFGLVHLIRVHDVDLEDVFFSILWQGVGGVVLCIVFFKSAAMRFTYVIDGLLGSFAFHSAWNTFVYALSKMPR